LHFSLPGLMSLLSLVDPASTALWRISFAIVAAGGVLALVLVRGPAPTGLGAAAYVAAVVLYVLIALVAVVPAMVTDIGVLARPLRVEAVLQYKDVRFGDGWRLELGAHLVLVLAAGFAGLALARTAEVRLVRRFPQGELAWLVVLLGAAGALALFLHDQNLWHIRWLPSHWLVISPSWVTVMALVVPACAALLVPRRFGVALLVGWIGGGAAFFVSHYMWARHQYGGQTGSNPIITFGCTLFALLVGTVLFARAVPGSHVDRTT
jgi:hypothetical protein